jgi:hypothetical protein
VNWIAERACGRHRGPAVSWSHMHAGLNVRQADSVRYPCMQ